VCGRLSHRHVRYLRPLSQRQDLSGELLIGEHVEVPELTVETEKGERLREEALAAEE